MTKKIHTCRILINKLIKTEVHFRVRYGIGIQGLLQFRFKAKRKVLGWFISTGFTVVYTSNFSLTRYLSVFITRVEDPQVYLCNFPLTRFLSLSKRQASFPGKVTVVSAVPSQRSAAKNQSQSYAEPKTKWPPQKVLVVSGQVALLLVKNRAV